jgi:hypothetical protein
MITTTLNFRPSDAAEMILATSAAAIWFLMGDFSSPQDEMLHVSVSPVSRGSSDIMLTLPSARRSLQGTSRGLTELVLNVDAVIRLSDHANIRLCTSARRVCIRRGERLTLDTVLE